MSLCEKTLISALKLEFKIENHNKQYEVNWQQFFIY